MRRLDECKMKIHGILLVSGVIEYKWQLNNIRLISLDNSYSIRHTSGISGGFRQLRIYVSAVMADFETFVMRPKEDTARDKLIPRKLVRQSRGDTKEEDVICYHSAHCRQILSIKTPLSSPSNSRII